MRQGKKAYLLAPWLTSPRQGTTRNITPQGSLIPPTTRDHIPTPLKHSYDPNSPQSPSGSSQAPRASSSLCCHPPRAPPYLSLHLTLLLFLLLGNACPWRPLPHRGLVCTSDPGSPRLLSAEHSLGTYRSPSPTQALLPTATPPGTASCIPPGPTAFTAGVSYFLLPGTR